MLLYINKATLLLLEGTDRLWERTVSQLLPNSTDLVISKQLETIINTSYYVKLHLHSIAVPAWMFPTEPNSGSEPHVASRRESCGLLGPFPADVVNAFVSQNQTASKKRRD